MEAAGQELLEIQQELQVVKQALRKGALHLGLQGEQLQRYFLQLNEKENLLLSRQLRHMGADSLLESAPSRAGAPGTNGSGPAGEAGKEPHVEPKPPPPGPVATFDRESLASVTAHMQAYEAVAAEASKALRALSSLAYSDAKATGSDPAALDQLLRVLAIHSADGGVQLAAMRALCNMAYSREVALKRLVALPVMGALLEAVARGPEPKDLGVRASEAVARIVAAEVDPDAAPSAEGVSALGGLFAAASQDGKPSWQEVVPRLVSQLVANEVVEVPVVAKSFVNVGRESAGATAAAGWLVVAKLLAAVTDCAELPQGLLDAGAIAAAAELMARYEAEGAVQLSGVEAMSSLVGNRWSGLQAFAEVGGIQRIEAGMQRHGGHVVLQTKGIRALASGITWPQDVQAKAKYVHQTAVGLTKTAMSQHPDDAELQAAALEALSKYLDKVRCVTEVTDSGGNGLVKAVMARHSDDTKVQHWGRTVLGAIGEDRNWTPKGIQA